MFLRRRQPSAKNKLASICSRLSAAGCLQQGGSATWFTIALPRSRWSYCLALTLKKNTFAGLEIAQQLRILVILLEDPDSVPRNHLVAHNQL